VVVGRPRHARVIDNLQRERPRVRRWKGRAGALKPGQVSLAVGAPVGEGENAAAEYLSPLRQAHVDRDGEARERRRLSERSITLKRGLRWAPPIP
jgi:hypothetical protein